jgi:hypothetical protein
MWEVPSRRRAYCGMWGKMMSVEFCITPASIANHAMRLLA